MATKQISQLPSTNISNDTDLLMTRQGAEDRQVTVEKVRNLGTENGQGLAVGGYGVGGNAVPITDLFSSNNADLITRDGVYLNNGTVNTPVAGGEIHHTQGSNNSATQTIVGDAEEFYVRKKVGGVWQAWFLVGAADKSTVRTDLGVYSKTETYTRTESDGRYLNEDSNLSDLPSKSTARTNLDVYSKSETDNRYLNEDSNLSDLNSAATARNNLGVYSKTEADARYLNEDSNLSDVPNKTTARNNLGVYSKTETDAIYLNEGSNLSDLSNVATARTNLGVYSKSEALADAAGSVSGYNIAQETISAGNMGIVVTSFGLSMAPLGVTSIPLPVSSTNLLFAPVFESQFALRYYYKRDSQGRLYMFVWNLVNATQTLEGSISAIAP